MMAKRIVNIADLELQDSGNGQGFQAKVGRAGPLLGLTSIGCAVIVLPPGKRAYPFHRHHVGSELFGSVDVIEYPDSGKIAAAAGIRNADFRTATFKTMGHIKPADYFEDEEPS